MSNNQDSRADRIARYKEERRKQLAEQFSSYQSPPKTTRTRTNTTSIIKDGSSSSNSGSPRPTRTTRLRAAALSQENISTQSQINITEKPHSFDSKQSELKSEANKKIDRDKSYKRKSNLNRSLNSEEVPSPELSNHGDLKDRRRRRRFFPAEIFESSVPNSGYEKESDTHTTASLTSPTLTSNTAVTPSKLSHKKSELSQHMENARRSVTSPFSEMGKYKPYAKRVVTSSPKSSIAKLNLDKVSSSDSLNRIPASPNNQRIIVSDDEKTKAIASRMEGLSALTKQTLARVERLTNKGKESPKTDFERASSRHTEQKKSNNNSKKPVMEKSLLFSILKKNSVDDTPSLATDPPSLPCASTTVGPVSILKRKVSQDSNKMEHTTPVTFSPSVLEPTTTRRKQGILKKRRSLDESSVMRHRSCSPEVASKADSRSILKNQRRSSLEELRRTQSPETPLQSILKRRTSKYEDDDQSLNSPQSILKRKSGASSASSTGSSPHVSITTAVILAAAGGAEMVLDSDGESVRPILKKKSFSEEHTLHTDAFADIPKPILKKKSSTDTDDSEDKPKPILKLPRASLELETFEFNAELKNIKLGSSSEAECEFKPILKQTTSREEPSRRLSFKADFSDNSSTKDDVRQKASRRSNTICNDFNIDSYKVVSREEDRLMTKPRPFSVYDLVMSLEQTSSTGAIPKTSHYKRNCDRYKTQPVTINELEASRILAKSSQPFSDDQTSNQGNLSRNSDTHSLLDLTSSLEKDDSHLNSFFSSSMHNQDSPESIACGKMSSDSAFQSLGDGLELEQVEEQLQESEQEQMNSNFRDVESHLRIRTNTEEITKTEFSKRNIGVDRYRSRRQGLNSQFRTQPVTSEEIKAATKITANSTDEIGDGDGNNSSDKRKNIFNSSEASSDLSSSTKSAFNRHNTTHHMPSKVIGTSTDKDDEGISCNDSDSTSDSDNSGSNIKESLKNDHWKTENIERKFVLDSTSEGESSGGREIKSIFKSDFKMKFQQNLEGVLSKSKSQDSFGNDSKLSSKNTRYQPQTEMPQAIAELQAKLQERGESAWKKRISLNNSASDELKLLKEKNKYNDEISEKSLLSAKKDELDAASKHWKSRVEKSDAEKFSVAGKMSNIKDAIPTINIPVVTDADKKPHLKRFKSKTDSDSTPTSPEKGHSCDLARSKSLSYSASFEYRSKGSEVISKIISKKSVSVFNPNDISLEKFFKKVEPIDNKEQIDFSLEDLDGIKREPLLVIRKNVQVPKRRKASQNPIKALASRTDISNEYTEICTGVAEREKKRLNIEKLAKNSNKALEALAGLASTEDFKSIALKKSSESIGQVPWKDIMLLQVKGRRHVQTRLVQPNANSINEGDNYILVTYKALYTYTGAYSNVIEQSRMSDIVNHIKKTGDLGCKVNDVYSISANDKSSNQALEFWKILGADKIPETIEAGHPDEDETYESNILLTNMIYTLDKDELISCDKYWGSIPKIEMLINTNIYVFDFGSEMYVWSGKNAPLFKKNLALKLAKEMWEEGYNYSDCNICPLNIASILGARTQEKLPMQEKARPKWALFAKLTQHRETILFKEKFLDWPDFSRVIRVKSEEENLNKANTTFDIYPCDVEKMLKENNKEPDLIVENIHMGRGDEYFDEETKRLFSYETLKVTGWTILEYTYEKLAEESLGQLYDGNSYIFRWDFRQTVKGRELSGNPSKHSAVGRDRCIFFYWQGNNSSTNEKGAAALLTVELDKQSAPQIRIVQGSEPAAFLQLFNGKMVVSKGKRETPKDNSRLFILRGEKENETYLMEVPLAMSSLRSRSSFVLLDVDNKQVIVWHGIKSTNIKRKNAKLAIKNLIENKPPELQIDQFEELNIIEVTEGSETEEFLKIVGNDRQSYYSLLDINEPFDHIMRLFRMCSITGEFLATEILCLHRSNHCSPYPFVQSDLYSASQPALFLIDNLYELWLWQGFWPEKEAEENPTFDQTGSGAVRWQAERKAAMQTAVNYWREKHEDKPVVAYLVSAGLEPVAFKSLFPAWEIKRDITEQSKKAGKKENEMLSLEEELALLSRTTYPLSELLQRPLPEGVDPTNIEKYLSPEDFLHFLSMTRDEFDKLPPWKQTALKKEKGLF